MITRNQQPAIRDPQLHKSNNIERYTVKSRTKMAPLAKVMTLPAILSSLKKLIDEEFSCPICKELCTDTLINPECGHRFCGKCIKERLELDNHECPSCKIHIASRSSCQEDVQLDHIVSPDDLSTVLFCFRERSYLFIINHGILI
jgi:hypothetical protein